jgi:hypothetical protein
MSDRPRSEKEEKEGQDEKGRGESWEEKWRRDPVDAAGWAAIFIWAGLVLLAGNIGILDNVSPDLEAWSVIFLGAGMIVLLGVAFRLLVPAYRRPVTGSLILGAVLVGVGLGDLVGWGLIGGLILIAIGVGALLGGFFRNR